MTNYWVLVVLRKLVCTDFVLCCGVQLSPPPQPSGAHTWHNSLPWPENAWVAITITQRFYRLSLFEVKQNCHIPAKISTYSSWTSILDIPCCECVVKPFAQVSNTKTTSETCPASKTHFSQSCLGLKTGVWTQMSHSSQSQFTTRSWTSIFVRLVVSVTVVKCPFHRLWKQKTTSETCPAAKTHSS